MVPGGMINSDRNGTTIELAVRPRSGRCRVVEATADRVRIEVCAPPEGGKATRQALKTLADALGVQASAVELLKGQTSRHKTVRVDGLDAADCLARLQAASG